MFIDKSFTPEIIKVSHITSKATVGILADSPGYITYLLFFILEILQKEIF